MAYVLAFELKDLCEKFGVENCGFFTLTVGDKNPPPIWELQRRFNSLRTGVLAGRYQRAILVVERGELRNRLHFHGVGVVGRDIRTDRAGNGPVDFEAIAAGDYSSANRNLRSEWRFWRETAPKYGFGRTELLPIKSTAEGIARYVGSYIKKQIMHRIEQDKGARLIRFVNYGPGGRSASSRFAWNTERSWLWRRKVEAWANRFSLHSMDEITDVCGPRWAYLFQAQILGTELDKQLVYPSHDTAIESLDLTLARECALANAMYEHDRANEGKVTRTVLLKEPWSTDERPF